MNLNFLNIVRCIAAEQGEGIPGDQARLKSFIKDYAKDEPKEDRAAFGRCIESGAYAALKTAPNAGERASRKAAIARRVRGEHGLDTALCAEALDILEAALFGAAPGFPASVKRRIPRTVLVAAGALVVIAAGIIITRPAWTRLFAQFNAKTILARCSKTRETFGIRVEERGGDWVRTGAFPVDERGQKRQNFDTEMISGSMDAADEYPGCPHCGSKGFNHHKSGCGKVFCSGSQTTIGNNTWKATCPWCGKTGTYVRASGFEVSGGSNSPDGSLFADN